MEEAVSGVKGELAVKLYGDDLRTLEQHGRDRFSRRWPPCKGIDDLGIFRIVGQPNLNFTVDRAAAARWGINVADIQDAMQTAVGSNAVTQVQQGEARYDVTLRYQQQFRDTREAIENVRLLAPSGERVSLAQLTPSQPTTAPSKSIAKAASATSPSSTPCAGATWLHGGRGHPAG